MDKYICYTRGCAKIDEKIEDSCLSGGCNKLNVHDWLKGIPESPSSISNVVEIRFKNIRKAYYQNVNNLVLNIGDLVAVEASPGHDIGIVSLTGELVKKQLKKNNIDPDKQELKKVYRYARSTDIDKWKEAMALEIPTMLRSRKIVEQYKLHMKVSDVEYQGDKTKAIFYYIADERVDFRELIKALAEEFKIRVEMRQIGARQEAGRIGGIGPCGRELCCTNWLTSFVSVTTTSARHQELSLNPVKLAGQCSKLKCCLNYELDSYLDAIKDFPNTALAIETKDGTAYHQKTDVFKRLLWYSFDRNNAMNMVAVPVDRVKEIILQNKKGIKVDKLVIEEEKKEQKMDYQNVVGQESITRFDEKKKSTKNRNKKRPQ
ncbi:MAG TPA: hypothetical protein DDX39_05730 [Bacteroidales bacterium]|nr:MAG: hypothetical protein A2W98_07000 [Bacteroidetes bacterium GWF2_33_38]OFY72427.1 MAG: hypothetical protein A2265_05345 [Bacteroidetes bacterium RIFOXYA12_FULL_33_9]OFY89349.1 MAG: hypothetical protein A2236_08110 [Bacteroidetes bacterium RIFOXYA2_FULL_33_7]HBF88124.1 hypothetical protein [Bacteroidales bacterium]